MTTSSPSEQPPVMPAKDYDVSNEATESAETIPEESRVLCTISADSALRALGFAAKNDIRFYLNGLNIRAAENPAVSASDGHVAYSEEDATGMAEIDVTVSIGTRSKSILKRGNRVVVEGTSKEATLTVVDPDGRVIYIEPGNALIFGTFPKLEVIFGDFDKWVEGMVGAFQIPLLQRIAGMKGAVRFYHPEGATGNECAFFTYRGPTGEKAIGGIMPYRALSTVKDAVPGIYLAA